MSDGMREALILSGVLLTIVLFTQVGRHRFGPVKLLLPVGFVLYVGYLILTDMAFTRPNITVASIGTGIGVAIGLLLLASMRVERDPGNRKAYTRAGLFYLAIWLVVLVGRLIFIWQVDTNDSFAKTFGEFMFDNGFDADGVAAFFVLMAMAMVLIRTIGVAIKVARMPATAEREKESLPVG